MDRAVEKEEWAPALEEFTERNAGRYASIEGDDPELGAQEQQPDLPLQGVVYDRRDDRIEIMFGRFEGAGPRLTHTIDRPTGLDILSDSSGRDTVLRIREVGAQTLVRVRV